jgi:hypothetical protein
MRCYFWNQFRQIFQDLYIACYIEILRSPNNKDRALVSHCCMDARGNVKPKKWKCPWFLSHVSRWNESLHWWYTTHQYTLSIITSQLHCFELRTTSNGKDVQFFSHGLCTEKQNILPQHMREKNFGFWWQ